MRLVFLLVRHSKLVQSYTVSEILQVFCAPGPTTIPPHFGGVPVGQNRQFWGQPEHTVSLKLISREIIFEVFQPM